MIVPFFFRKNYSKFLPTYSAYCYLFVHQELKQPCKVNTFFVTIWHNIVFDNDNFLERIINSFQWCLFLRMPSYLFPFEIHCKITIFFEQRVACPNFFGIDCQFLYFCNLQSGILLEYYLHVWLSILQKTNKTLYSTSLSSNIILYSFTMSCCLWCSAWFSICQIMMGISSLQTFSS